MARAPEWFLLLAKRSLETDVKTESKPSPVLSVVIVALDGGKNLARCIRALKTQQGPPAMELIVAIENRLHDPKMAEQFPDVGFVWPSPGRHTFAELRAAGVRITSGEIVAITEDQCIPPPNWCANVVAAHRERPNTAIGGPVDKEGSDTALNWAIYLRELGVGYMPPVTDGPSSQLTDCNVTYKRASLDAMADIWRDAFHEPKVHEALEARGDHLWLASGLLTMQQRSFRLGPALRERYEFGRLYGAMRVTNVPASRRMMMAAASLVLPFLLVSRVFLSAFHKGRHRWQCFRALFFLSLFAAVWSWGELLGYLTALPPVNWRAGQRTASP